MPEYDSNSLMQSENLESQSAFATFLLLICCFFCLYTLTFNGVFRVDDEHILAARTQSLALWGELSEPQVFGNQRVQALIPLGDPATQIEPGQAALGAVLVKLAQIFSFGSAQALFSLNILLTAITAGVVFFIVQALGFSQRVGIWCTVFFGVGSMAWPYATTYFRDPLAMMMSGVALLGWARLQRVDDRRRWTAYLLIAFGLFAGALAKNNVAVLLPALACMGIFRLLRPPGGRKPIACRWVAAFLFIGSVLLVLILVPEKGPFARFSLDYYRFLADHFMGSISTDLLVAFAGPFFSPAKSILLFSPPLLIGLFSLRRGMKTDPDYTGLALLYTAFLALAQGLFYRERWAGGFGWGLKYMLPALPALIPLLAPVIDVALRHDSPRGRRWPWVMLGVSAIIQLSAALVSWNRVYLDWQAQGLDPYVTTAAWDVHFLAIPGQVMRLVSVDRWSLAWPRLIQSCPAAVLVVFLLASVCGGIAITSIQKVRSRKISTLVLFTASTLILLTFTAWWAVSFDPDWGAARVEFQDAFSAVTDRIGTGDVILIDSYGTDLWYFWMNNWDKPQRWYSLPFSFPASVQEGDFQPQVSPAVEQLVSELADGAGSIWYVTSTEAADYAAQHDQRWLAEQLSLDSCAQFDGDTRTVVCKFDP